MREVDVVGAVQCDCEYAGRAVVGLAGVAGGRPNDDLAGALVGDIQIVVGIHRHHLNAAQSDCRTAHRSGEVGAGGLGAGSHLDDVSSGVLANIDVPRAVAGDAHRAAPGRAGDAGLNAVIHNLRHRPGQGAVSQANGDE